MYRSAASRAWRSCSACAALRSWWVCSTSSCSSSFRRPANGFITRSTAYSQRFSRRASSRSTRAWRPHASVWASYAASQSIQSFWGSEGSTTHGNATPSISP